MSLSTIRVIFLVAALYDIILGLSFSLWFKTVYQWFEIELPNHPAYVQLPGLLIAVLGVGFLFVFADPQQNRNIAFLGVLMKLDFTGVAFGHWLVGSIPTIYVILAVCDAIFALLFVAAYLSLKGSAPGPKQPAARS